MNGVFIEVTLDQAALSPALSAEIARVCPVDIFGVDDGRLTVRAQNQDECTLCALCLRIAPSGAIRIRKLYSDETLISGGAS
ncbi:MAG: hypothetical protein SGI73_05405 [Chloroflexota bacterium]|nr:hypothetical protein [Chloroflexota bacterium]